MFERVQDILKVYSKSRTAAVFLVQRSKIILMASQGTSSKEISYKIGKHYNTVALWRKRFIEAASVLTFVEAGSSRNNWKNWSSRFLAMNTGPVCPKLTAMTSDARSN